MTQDFGVYLVTGAEHSAGRSTAEVVEAAIRGGVDIVQLRDKTATARERYEVGTELRTLTRDAGVPLVVNDRLDLAAAIDADGVHLGDDDLPIEVAREQLGSDAIVGRSVSTPDAAREAEQAGADYLGVGAIYGTDSKDTDPEQSNIGLDRIRAVRDATSLPFVGIGGVTPDNAAPVVEAGADGVAVISAITAADDPEHATRRLADAVEGVAPNV
ncbi:thiamine-phosphate synthase [Natronomonas pharaonis DSM 2160]|uniref:Thiamine-phosphate synthase n=1 Tax=Natronomonas pharaonis (strain ATCC 35678 / DSM 2160 / CIP 103997 / JCM 8858 / NBRC 14720 / NCIMB 2260 / Gabara) TaxID=348780 RepID=THIE_NATPD|nr:thiamine phosphate synthase [Natronomonas pharaonis]Q3IP34.1 RecName: Full=Thiamine-phosphate synthase; Short=TP synthase; Short=TPS; AltName: Full=Thiamine-phosphate pyrophosphorylase; Short=TMP pyrophosphorylase; Short=TMP-PPase [Natronomonas pharaonis DSM 2160]CAI50118.1 thiamine-phosphate synthase [Natronomonas pharaonis DSM 2160]